MLIKKIPDTCGFMTQQKIIDHNHSNYITTQEFNNLMAENVKERLKQANLVSKTDFDNKLVSFNKKITSNKIKVLIMFLVGNQREYIFLSLSHHILLLCIA